MLLCLLLSPIPNVFAQTAGQRAGEIGALRPDATRNAEAVKVKDALAWNDFLRTLATGRLRANLVDDSMLSMGSSSELKVVQHDAASQQTALELNYGRLRSRVVQLTKPGAKFEVKTPHAVIGVIGTDFYIFVDADRTLVIVFSGKVQVIPLRRSDDRTVPAVPVPPGADVGEGQMIECRRSGLVGQPSATPPSVQQDAIDSTTVEEPSTGGKWTKKRKVLVILAIAAAIAIGVAIGVTRDDSTSTGP